MNVSDVIDALHTYAVPEAELLINSLCGCGFLAKVPLDALLNLASAVAKEVEAKNELAAMRAAVQGADAAADAAEQAALEATQGK